MSVSFSEYFLSAKKVLWAYSCAYLLHTRWYLIWNLWKTLKRLYNTFFKNKMPLRKFLDCSKTYVRGILFQRCIISAYFLLCLLREGIKRRTFYGQADRKRLPPFPLLRSAFWDLWFYGFYTRKFIFIQLKEFPAPLFCRCYSVTKRPVSGNRGIKGIKNAFLWPLTIR